MDLHVIARLLEKAHEYSVLIRTDRNEARGARRQTSVVAEGGDEPAAAGEASDAAAELGNRVNGIQMRERVAHANHKGGAFPRQKPLVEDKQIVTVNLDRQTRR